MGSWQFFISKIVLDFQFLSAPALSKYISMPRYPLAQGTYKEKSCTFIRLVDVACSTIGKSNK